MLQHGGNFMITGGGGGSREGAGGYDVQAGQRPKISTVWLMSV